MNIHEFVSMIACHGSIKEENTKKTSNKGSMWWKRNVIGKSMEVVE
jgi:hypothetical protein